jgi:hypothetical protein
MVEAALPEVKNAKDSRTNALVVVGGAPWVIWDPESRTIFSTKKIKK